MGCIKTLEFQIDNRWMSALGIESKPKWQKSHRLTNCDDSESACAVETRREKRVSFEETNTDNVLNFTWAHTRIMRHFSLVDSNAETIKTELSIFK